MTETPSQAPAAGQHDRDHRLKEAICSELQWAPEVRSDHIGVAITQGAVTLSGQVLDYPERQAAVRAALRVHGVSALVDQIVVRRESGARADADLARDAAAVVGKADPDAERSVQATVRDGVITLSGTTAWQYQRQAVAEALSALDGVVDVVNDITLDPTVDMLASTARAKITAAIVRGAREEAGSVGVHVEGSEITLSGNVTSWAERHQAEYAAWCTPGVTHVDNRMTIST